MKIIREFSNKIEDCLELDSNFKILEKTNGVVFNPPIIIVKKRLTDYEETNDLKEKEESLEKE